MITVLARQAAWLPAPGSAEPPDLNDSEAGDTTESARSLRNLAAHPGSHIRQAPQARLGETACRNAYGIAGAVFDATYSVIQSLDAVGRPGESGGDALTGRDGR